MFRSEGHLQRLGFLVFFVLGCGQDVPVAVESADVSAVPVQPISSIKASEPPMMPLDLIPTPKLPTKKGLTAVGSATHDFGDVQQKTELRHDFVLTNEADVPIRIVSMLSSCSCAWAESNDKFIGSLVEPNQRIDFPLFIRTGTLQDRANGKITITYRFQSNNPYLALAGEEKFTLEVNGTILPDYRIEPQNIRFGEVRALESQTAKAVFRIVPVQLEALEISSIKPSSKLLTAKILSSGKEGYEIEVTFDGSTLANSEFFTGHLIIETNSEKLPKGMVSVDATYLAPVNFDKTEIIIPSDEEGIVKETIQVTSSVPSQVRKIDTGSSGLIRVDFDAAQKTEKHDITVSVDPCRVAEIHETITLEIVLFPAGGESIIQTCPVTIYRFHKGEKL